MSRTTTPQPDVSRCRVIIAVFAMPECAACELYVPRLARAARARRSFVVHDGVSAIPRGKVPILCYDVSAPDEAVQAFASRYAVEATPTTVVIPADGGAFKVEGNLTDEQISYILTLAEQSNR